MYVRIQKEARHCTFFHRSIWHQECFNGGVCLAILESCGASSLPQSRCRSSYRFATQRGSNRFDVVQTFFTEHHFIFYEFRFLLQLPPLLIPKSCALKR